LQISTYEGIVSIYNLFHFWIDKVWWGAWQTRAFSKCQVRRENWAWLKALKFTPEILRGWRADLCRDSKLALRKSTLRKLKLYNRYKTIITLKMILSKQRDCFSKNVFLTRNLTSCYKL
jgi:hypothetical protein